MVEAFTLSWDEDRVAIFTREATKNIQKKGDAEVSNALLTAVISCLQRAKPQHEIEKGYADCAELQQLRQGNWRIYCRYVHDLPEYGVLWIFAIRKHQYRNPKKFDAEACAQVEQLASLTTVGQVEGYLDRNEAMTIEELKELRESF